MSSPVRLDLVSAKTMPCSDNIKKKQIWYQARAFNITIYATNEKMQFLYFKKSYFNSMLFFLNMAIFLLPYFYIVWVVKVALNYIFGRCL